MDGANIYKASHSIRHSGRSSRMGSTRNGSTSVWRDQGMDVFSKSTRDEDDEEALKWASLEKLPTFDRLRKGLLLGSQGDGFNEVDIDNLGMQQRKNLLERLVKVAEEDNEKFLLKLRDRIDRVGVELPTIEVRFENLNIEAEAFVGSRALPSFINFNLSLVEGLLSIFHLLPNNKKKITILEDVSGVLKPCRMTLLLGPPSSGKTTLMLALAGKLDPTLKTSGNVTYNGHSMQEFVPQRTAAYISQYDLHIGEMTVKETLAFSARCQGVGSRYEMLAELARREKDANIKPDPDVDIYMKAAATAGQEASVVTDYVLKVLGLDVCADTMVGDQMIRGISGGQKKRVTTGEIKGVADFLQEVTSKKDQRQYWLHRDQPYRFITSKEFSEAFQSFHVGHQVGNDLATSFDKSKSHPAALTTKKYGVNKTELLKAVTAREILLMKRNSFVYVFKLFQLTMMALITMTLFLRTELNQSNVEEGVGVWVFLTYYVIGFDPNVARFAKQYLILLLINQMASALFRMVGALGRTMILANTFGGFALLILFALGGFVLARGDVADYWIWGYYSSPMMYGMNAIAVNEFLGDQWSKLNSYKNETIGVAVLKSRGFFPYSYWYWIGAGALVGFILILNFGYTLALMYLNPLGKPQAVVPEESDAAGEAAELAGNNQNKKKGMVLPFEPHSITFDDIKYSVDMPQEMKEQGVAEDRLLLLKGVSGAFRPAWLRLPSEVDTDKRKMFVNEVLELVELDTLKEALVGLPGVNGLSTEQRKRLTIAVELVSNPSIIFMDEPTSGLDARAAAIVMRTVRNTVDTGRTVVCTIHQPSIDIFEAFDELFLMKRGGLELYAGPVGRQSCELIEYFEAIQGINKIKDGYNPATWMLEVTASSQEMILGVDFTAIYHNSDLYKRNKALIRELSTPRPGSSDISFPTIMFGSMFWDLGSKIDTRQDLFNAMGSMYAACLFLGVQNAASVQPVVAVERTVFYRERAAGMYSALPYAFAQVLVEIPYVLFQAGDSSFLDLVHQNGGDGMLGKKCCNAIRLPSPGTKHWFFLTYGFSSLISPMFDLHTSSQTRALFSQ
ncbi:hypothetical protein POM88_032242 [Heracleum sosnowskyi]|uniref:ABC transporter domain-containing protein n=1 Tax=Heracleum sosnowskyi TaxID=360622 RepID=A0AAD8I060_9APIA|nr:hypothetical protein POM88_032242 [Heracleum sosnowskyi]